MKRQTLARYILRYLDQSPAILTSDDFIRSNEIIRTKWPIYVVINRPFCSNDLMISSEVRIAGDQSN